MLAISLMRMGAKGKPFYRLVVKEKRSKRDGKYLENVGTYNPMLDPAEVTLNHERIQYWIGVGAQPTDTVKSLIKNNPEGAEKPVEAAVEAPVKTEAAAPAEAPAVAPVEAPVEAPIEAAAETPVEEPVAAVTEEAPAEEKAAAE